MAILWRVSPRSGRTSLAALLTQRRGTAAGGLIGFDSVFGLVGQATTGQGAQTSDISASASAPAGATIQTGQGAQTSDIAAGVRSVAAIETGQGSQTSDLVATTPFVATIETGQGSQTSDYTGLVTDFQLIAPLGWWDSANAVVQPGASLWQYSPRINSVSFVAMVVSRGADRVLGSVGEDAAFTAYSRTEYSDGIGGASVSSSTQYVVPSGVAQGAFGSATVYNLTQYLVPSTANAGPSFGTANVELFTRYLQASGAAHAAFGTAYVFDPTLYVVHSGAAYSVFGTALVQNLTRVLSPLGVAAGTFGTAAAQNLNRTIYPPRITPGTPGTPTVVGPRYITGAKVGKTDVFGTTLVQGPRTVKPAGRDAASIGRPAVSHFNRTIRAAGRGFGLFGSARVFNDALGISPEGIPSENETIYEPIVGEPPLAVLEVAGINDGAFGTAELDDPPKSGYIKRATAGAVGAFGTAYIEPHWIGPKGTSFGTYGKPTVSNWIRYVKPTGLSAFKYGPGTWVSNYVRYLEPKGVFTEIVWDDYGPVTGPEGAARVYNKTGVVRPVGAKHSAIGAATVKHSPC